MEADGIQSILDTLPAVATSPLAFGAYVCAVLAWVVVAWRIKRNKNVLNALAHVPPDQRLQALKAEMGVIDVRGGISAEQWLHARRQFYYLVAAIVAALLLLLLAALVIHGTSVQRSSAAVPDRAVERVYQTVFPLPDGDESAVLDRVRLRVSRQFFEFRAGPPRMERDRDGSTFAAYSFSSFLVLIVYNHDDEVVQYSVTLTDPEAKVPAPFHGEGHLGELTFADLQRDHTLEPWFFNFSTKDWQYVEGENLMIALSFGKECVFYSAFGADMGTSGSQPGTVDALMKFAEREELTDSERQLVESYRETARPNGYGGTVVPLAEDDHGLFWPIPLVDYETAPLVQ